MQLILFFTDSKRLSDIGVLLPWESEKRFHQFKVVQGDTGEEPHNQQIWIVWDKIGFDELEEQLDATLPLSEVYYVYHSYPLVDFRDRLEDYLGKRKIFHACQNSPQIPNCDSTFETINGHADPFTSVHFTRITEKIHPCRKYVYRMLNYLDVRRAVENKMKLINYPGWARDIYNKVMVAVTPENFELKRNELQTELERHCQGRS